MDIHPKKSDLILERDRSPQDLRICPKIFSKTGCELHYFRTDHFGLQICSCEKNSYKSHFINPKYICCNYFYETSINSNNKIKCKCPHLHLSWRNYIKNLFHSDIDDNKKLNIKFLKLVITELIITPEDKEFKRLMEIHEKFIYRYNKVYHPKCKLCGLKPYQERINNIRLILAFISKKKKNFLCLNLIQIIHLLCYPKNHSRSDCTYTEGTVCHHINRYMAI